MVEVSDGAMHLKASRSTGSWLTGGVSNFPITQMYGMWLVRFRITKSDDISFHMLLWPKNEVWPPEIDFLESSDGTRATGSVAVHYKGWFGVNSKYQEDVTGDFSNWTIAGVQWGPGQVRFLINGNVVQTFTSSYVPATPMWLGMQLESNACAQNASWGLPPCPRAGSPSSASMDIDWVSVYKPGWM